MDSRREFVKKATLLAGGAGLFNAMPASIQKAFAIDPAAGSTYLDAKHVVILMQENRSFDHCYGTLQGVRGYNDPRAITLPDGDKVECKGRGLYPLSFKYQRNQIYLDGLPAPFMDQPGGCTQ